MSEGWDELMGGRMGGEGGKRMEWEDGEDRVGWVDGVDVKRA